MSDAIDLARLGWDAAWGDQAAPYRRDGLQPARVVGVDRGACDLLGAGGDLRATWSGDVLAVSAADPELGPCAGDWGLVRDWPDGRRTLEVLLERRTSVRRAVASGESRGQVLAANADVVLLVVSLSVEPHLARLERLVALAWESGATPLVVLTKADLVRDAWAVRSDVAASAPGVGVLVVSAVSGEGLGDLRAAVPAGVTAALLGQSGVGKSTLVNVLLGREEQAVAPLAAAGKGRHTTVRRELLVLPEGGLLLDTPGLRGVGLVDLDEGLGLAFPEIEALAQHCRFGDCGHVSEPGCAVREAVTDGTVPARRLESWLKLQRERRWMARRGDSRARIEEKRRHKALSRSVRRAKAIRP